uniref:Gnk2-homologous domain-containing protein n=1 Tax=Rhabditophanes sp. KR3021 TaxID=114890 RepID=A0AC35U760_9BILA
MCINMSQILFNFALFGLIATAVFSRSPLGNEFPQINDAPKKIGTLESYYYPQRYTNEEEYQTLVQNAIAASFGDSNPIVHGKRNDDTPTKTCGAFLRTRLHEVCSTCILFKGFESNVSILKACCFGKCTDSFIRSECCSE